jgi:hypothetical protein
MGFFDIFKKKTAAEKEFDQAMENIGKQAFPNGEADIKKDTNAIHALFGGKLSLEECRKFVCSRKALVIISQDKTAERMIPSFIIASGNKITENEAYQAYLYFTGGGLSYSGGDGLTKDNPVVIHAKTSTMGIPAEYAYIEKRYGKQDEDWKVGLRFHGKSDKGRSFETFNIVLKNGQEVTIHFDITEFFGKF